MYDQINTFSTLLALMLFLWTIPWKIYAVWLAVKNGHKKWFVALLVLNTAGLLEIFYIFKVAHKSWEEVQGAFRRTLHGKTEKHHKSTEAH
jgi:hypothetical protein